MARRSRSVELQLPRNWRRSSHQKEQLASYLRNYALSVGVVWQERGKPSPQWEIYSGTLLRYRGLPHWITAAHNLAQLDFMRRSPKIRVISARWYDNPGAALAGHGIPIDLGRLAMKHFDDSEAIDVGVAWPTSSAWQLMEASPNYQPFSRNECRIGPSLRSEGVFVVGFPSETRSSQFVRHEGSRREFRFEAKPICIPLVAAASPKKGHEDDPFWRNKHSYYARIPPHWRDGRFSLESIRGVSGGPVVLVHRRTDGSTGYRLIGIQCGWLEAQRVVRIEPIPIALRMLDDLIQMFEVARREQLV